MEVMGCYEKVMAAKNEGLKMKKFGLYLRWRAGKLYIAKTHKHQSKPVGRDETDLKYYATLDYYYISIVIFMLHF